MINSIIITEAVLITLLICMCIYVTATDFKHGIIQNKILLITGAIGLVANIVYYGLYGRPFLTAFLLNLITSTFSLEFIISNVGNFIIDSYSFFSLL